MWHEQNHAHKLSRTNGVSSSFSVTSIFAADIRRRLQKCARVRVRDIPAHSFSTHIHFKFHTHTDIVHSARYRVRFLYNAERACDCYRCVRRSSICTMFANVRWGKIEKRYSNTNYERSRAPSTRPQFGPPTAADAFHSHPSQNATRARSLDVHTSRHYHSVRRCVLHCSRTVHTLACVPTERNVRTRRSGHVCKSPLQS